MDDWLYPWFNQSKESLIRRCRQTGAPDLWFSYQLIDNRLTSVIRQSKKDFVESTLTTADGKPCSIHNALRKLLPSKNKTLTNSFKVDTKLITDPLQISNKFNEYFLTIGESLHDTYCQPWDNNTYDTLSSHINSPFIPCYFRKAKVRPIYKSADPADFSNYRPISGLPIISKLLERAFNNQLITFLSANNMITHSQSGFCIITPL